MAEDNLPYSLYQIKKIRERLESIEVVDTKITFNNNVPIHDSSVPLLMSNGVGPNTVLGFLLVFFTFKVEGVRRTYRVKAFNFGVREITDLLLKISFGAKKSFPKANSPTHLLAERKALLIWEKVNVKLKRATNRKDYFEKVRAKVQKAARRKMNVELKKAFIQALALGYRTQDITRLWTKLEQDVKASSIIDA